MKRFILTAAAALCGVLLALYLLLTLPLGPGRGLPPQFRTSGKTIQLSQNSQWVPFEVVGVNLGTGYPGAFPNDLSIDGGTYARWFQQIADMNANTIRVYQLQSPDFYRALLDYNESHEKKLYLLQSLDFPDHFMHSEKNILDPEVHQPLLRLAEDTVRALHGDLLRVDGEQRFMAYTADMSPYVLGYLLGVEWDEFFVEYTCRQNPSVSGFTGNFLTCGPEANPFEVFLAQWGDHLLTYEADRYHTQKLISFCNWAETDPLVNKIDEGTLHSSADGQIEMLEAFVDTDRIRPTEALQTGTFASYNIYPYYPLFLQMGQYTDFVDETGAHNPYRNYLTQLNAHHKTPVVITEYGLPASRSTTYKDKWRNMSHGGLTEQQQGEAVATLFRDIRKAGCAGSLVFTWQDEWYKRTWNEMFLSDPDMRPFWSNAMCVEQLFGLLAFEPGEAGDPHYPDGDLSEWTEADVLLTDSALRLSVRSDEKYVHLLLEATDPAAPALLSAPAYVALDIHPEMGSSTVAGHQLGFNADFLLRLSAQPGQSALFVHREADVLAYSQFGVNRNHTLYQLEKLTQAYAGLAAPLENDPAFSVVARANEGSRLIPFDASHVNEVGRLTPGNANPAAPDYNSNADYCATDRAVEVRIPWQLLNFSAPSRAEVLDNIGGKLSTLEIDDFSFSVFRDGGPQHVDAVGSYRLKSWKQPQFHERLKQSYYILQRAFGEVA